MRTRPFHLLPVAGALVMMLEAPVVLAQTAAQPWKFSVTAATVYDDNILRYSEKYIERFNRGQDAGRFHINSIDDLVLQSSVSAERFFRIRRNWTAVLFAEARNRLYTHNSVKNWSALGVGIRQRWGTGAVLSVSYNHLPDFYVRHYRDDDWVQGYGYTAVTFKPYSFSRNELRSWLQHTVFKSTRIRLLYSRFWYYHNQHFTEYDSRDNVLGIDLSHPLQQNVRVSAGYRFTSSDAKGYDEPGETRTDSDDGDASYNEDGVRVGVEWQLPRIMRLGTNLALNAEYARQSFTTKRDAVTDPMHAGRLDHEFGVSISYTVVTGKNTTLAATYEWRGRDAGSSKSENTQFVSDEKDYTQSRVGLEFRYVLNF